MLHIVKPNEIDSVICKDLGASEWMVIDQERIDKFADATMDHQFIHVDPVSYTHLTLPTILLV